jgi:flagellar hook assembly protein FlgD
VHGSLKVSPNPCYGTGTINLALCEPSDVTLVVYDLSGRTVRTLLKDKVLGGNQRICWDGTDEAGIAVPQGTYICRLNAGRSSTTAVIQLLR